MARSTIRIGNLSRAFAYGRSEMYNRIAQICVLYEDLKLETGKLFIFVQQGENLDVRKRNFEIMYYIRRSTASLMEFRGALNELNRDKEFEQRLRLLGEKYVLHIRQANEFFQANHATIKGLRNDFGGHVAINYVRHAISNFHPNDTGKLEWREDPDHFWWLDIDLAANIIASGLEHSLRPNEDITSEFHNAIQIIGAAYNHVQQSTFALAYCFLWKNLQ